MKSIEDWKKKLGFSKKEKKKDTSSYKCAEALVISFSSPRTAKKRVVLAHMCESLNDNAGMYKKMNKDSRGVMVGIMPERNFDDQETFVAVVKEFMNNGWEFENGDPTAVKILKQNGILL